MENNKKTHVFRGNLWKTLGEHKFSLGTHGKLKESTCVQWKPMKTVRKNTCFPLEYMEKKRMTNNLEQQRIIESMTIDVLDGKLVHSPRVYSYKHRTSGNPPSSLKLERVGLY